MVDEFGRYIANHVKGILKDMSQKGDMQEGDMVDAVRFALLLVSTSFGLICKCPFHLLRLNRIQLADMKEKQAEVYNAEKEAARNVHLYSFTRS